MPRGEYSEANDRLICHLKEADKLSWQDLAVKYNEVNGGNNSQGSLQVHYARQIKGKMVFSRTHPNFGASLPAPTPAATTAPANAAGKTKASARASTSRKAAAVSSGRPRRAVGNPPATAVTESSPSASAPDGIDHPPVSALAHMAIPGPSTRRSARITTSVSADMVLGGRVIKSRAASSKPQEISSKAAAATTSSQPVETQSAGSQEPTSSAASQTIGIAPAFQSLAVTNRSSKSQVLESQPAGNLGEKVLSGHVTKRGKKLDSNAVSSGTQSRKDALASASSGLLYPVVPPPLASQSIEVEDTETHTNIVYSVETPAVLGAARPGRVEGAGSSQPVRRSGRVAKPTHKAKEPGRGIEGRQARDPKRARFAKRVVSPPPTAAGRKRKVQEREVEGLPEGGSVVDQWGLSRIRTIQKNKNAESRRSETAAILARVDPPPAQDWEPLRWQDQPPRHRVEPPEVPMTKDGYSVRAFRPGDGSDNMDMSNYPVWTKPEESLRKSQEDIARAPDSTRDIRWRPSKEMIESRKAKREAQRKLDVEQRKRRRNAYGGDEIGGKARKYVPGKRSTQWEDDDARPVHSFTPTEFDPFLDSGHGWQYQPWVLPGGPAANKPKRTRKQNKKW
ncbi:hypothetical protein P152DRAFT_473968 [Eremomyces bilateralis CBS 781.70]|uniref:Uncharacterized protein n=1 Tax=Eremomyces bilateralis CBS 781.70 TaxID=1392243 RepID=A0A6G1G2W3_9PEZI|nr:uncharacterized protein P152DRAFT_473968 [Eremomyces bilateralis CBS 781.70]KAF1812256.1 hypothetical protein P152DRAFT_473968 [Eremomyces bilateralis CBS 781.70]